MKGDSPTLKGFDSVDQGFLFAPNFLVWKFCGNAEFLQLFETLRKLCVSIKFLHHDIKVFYAVAVLLEHGSVRHSQFGLKQF